MTNTISIKALHGFKRSPAGQVLARGNAVLAGVYSDKNDYDTPPIDQTTLKSQLDGLSAAISAALDGGKTAIAVREQQKDTVVKSLRQLGNYVEVACKDDITLFLKSGFLAASTTRTRSVPTSEHIRKIVAGKISGQVEVTLVAQREAFAYQLQLATVGQGGALGPWVERPIAKTRPATVISGLTPGTTYVFQVRALTDSGYTDWSESVTRIVI
jgi:hypothetical protein